MTKSISHCFIKTFFSCSSLVNGIEEDEVVVKVPPDVFSQLLLIVTFFEKVIARKSLAFIRRNSLILAVKSYTGLWHFLMATQLHPNLVLNYSNQIRMQLRSHQKMPKSNKQELEENENVLIQFVISCPMSYFPKNRKSEYFYHMDLSSRPFFSKPAPLKRKTNKIEVCAYENDLLDPDASSKLVKQGM